MPNRTAHNAFYYFMLQFEEKQKALGEKYENKSQLAEAAGPAWAAVPPVERARFKEMAIASKKDAGCRRTVSKSGVSVLDILRRDQQQKEAEMARKAEIADIVKKGDLMSILAKNFYMLDVICFTEGLHHVAGEMTVLRWNLQDGIKENYHQLLYPGEISYDYEVMRNCKEYGLERPDEYTMRTNYKKLLANLVAFLTEDGIVQPIYTTTDKEHKVEMFLVELCTKAGGDGTQFTLYKLEPLFYRLTQRVAEWPEDALPREANACHLLSRDHFLFSDGLACQRHEEIDNPFIQGHCTSSRTKRWAFTVMEKCCSLAGISLVAGKHRPRDPDTSNIIFENVDDRRDRALDALVLDEPSDDVDHDNTSDRAKRVNPMHSAEETKHDDTSAVAGTSRTSKKSLEYVPMRKPNKNYALKMLAAPPINADLDFPENPRMGAGRGRGLTALFKKLEKM